MISKISLSSLQENSVPGIAQLIPLLRLIAKYNKIVRKYLPLLVTGYNYKD